MIGLAVALLALAGILLFAIIKRVMFKRELEESQLLNPAGYIVTISEKIEPRDAETGIIPFKLTVSLETAGKDSK